MIWRSSCRQSGSATAAAALGFGGAPATAATPLGRGPGLAALTCGRCAAGEGAACMTPRCRECQPQLKRTSPTVICKPMWANPVFPCDDAARGHLCCYSIDPIIEELLSLPRKHEQRTFDVSFTENFSTNQTGRDKVTVTCALSV